MKKIVTVLAVLFTLCIGMVAEAASIPTNRVPLHTYAYKRVDCYSSPNYRSKRGYIDPGDYVIVTKIQSDGWAYGSYPVNNGRSRTNRWFRINDLIANPGWRDSKSKRYSPTQKTAVYKRPNYKESIGWVNDNEELVVVSNGRDGRNTEGRQIVYKLNGGGYKMGWVPYWDCWDVSQLPNNNNNNNSNKVKGDVNGDGKVDNSDLQLLKNYLVGTSSAVFIKANADMNGDGKITTTDVSQLQLAINSGTRSTTATTTTTKANNWWYPVNNGKVQLGWGQLNRSRGMYHLGTDFVATNDKNVCATADGIIVNYGWNGSNGNYVIIKHPNALNGQTVYSFYAHLASVSDNVIGRKGKSIGRGVRLGVMGKTGEGAGNMVHLHFAIESQNAHPSGGVYGYYWRKMPGNKITLGTQRYNGKTYYYKGNTYYNPTYVLDNERLP